MLISVMCSALPGLQGKHAHCNKNKRTKIVCFQRNDKRFITHCNRRRVKKHSLLFVSFPPYFVVIFRIQFFPAFGTDCMAEHGIGMFADIGFYLLPIPFVITNFLAGGANREITAQCFHFCIGFLKFEYQFLALLIIALNLSFAKYVISAFTYCCNEFVSLYRF